MKKENQHFDLDKVIDVSSVHDISPKAAIIISTDNKSAFYEDGEINPLTLEKGDVIMPWGCDNHMPYDILDLIQSDETISTCHTFNTELMYGGGLKYKAKESEDGEEPEKPESLEAFLEENNISRTFYGSCLDIKHWGFCVTLITMDGAGKNIASVSRLDAINCRFEVADERGNIGHVFYANWKKFPYTKNYVKYILLNPAHPLRDLRERIAAGTKTKTFAILSSVPGIHNYYYPIPQYGCIFRSHWFNIKQLVAISKENKMRNSAPIKYHVEINKKYWDNLRKRRGVTKEAAMKELVNEKKQEIIEFLTSAENSGKSFFSEFCMSVDGKEEHDIKITPVTSGKEGGDWEQDYQEAVNTICFAMGVHSNLVGSVPGKAQTNNSGSDKRELYTIAQLRQRAYHDVVLEPHRLICRFNEWRGFKPVVPLLMLTTLDEHKDVKPMNTENNGTDK